MFVVQFGGGISTEVALASGAKDVTVAEGNRAILAGVPQPTCSRNFTGNILSQGARRRLRGPAFPRAHE